MPENTQMLWSWNWKAVFLYLKSAPSNLSTLKIWRKIKNAQIWNQKSFSWVFSGDNFKNTIVILEISPTQFCLFPKFDQKTEMPRFRTRIAWFGYFVAEIWKQYCLVRNQHPHISLIAKFLRKTKMRKFGIKNPLFGYFWPKMFYLGKFGRKF